MLLDGKSVFVTGGTGSLGSALVRRIAAGELGRPERITIYSRDEAKQQDHRLSMQAGASGEPGQQRARAIHYRIGDIRDRNAVANAIRGHHVVVHAAALKQVPSCEYVPFEAVQTNVIGSQNVISAVRDDGGVEAVVGVSTDKACKPVNVMGMTKALMERLFIEANLEVPQSRFVCVRYGNVLASRGSAVPLFLDQIARGGPVTLTAREMTRFLITVDQAVSTIFAALLHAGRGEICVPRMPAARMVDLVEALIGDRKVVVEFTGARPGEKLHEVVVAEEECSRAAERNGYYMVRPSIPELDSGVEPQVLEHEFSSNAVTIGREGIQRLLSATVSEYRSPEKELV